MKELENLKELYLEEIKKINKKGELTPVDAESAKKALEAIKSIDEICCNWDEPMNEGYSERGYSMRHYPMSRRMPDMMHFGYGYDRDYSDRYYSDGPRYSDRRGRSPMTGRYISRHAAPEVDGMIHKLESMRMDAPDEDIRMAIDKMSEKLENY